MNDSYTLTDERSTAIWIRLVTDGISNALGGLGEMVGKQIITHALNARTIPVASILELLGGGEELTVGIYLGVSGSATGHMVLVYQPSVAYDFVDMLLGNPPGTTQTLGEMELSALGEMGNVMGSFFLNSLADATGLLLNPSPPAVMMDMAGAIMDVALADIIRETDDALVVDATFGTQDSQSSGTFMVLPSLDLQRVLVDALRQS